VTCTTVADYGGFIYKGLLLRAKSNAYSAGTQMGGNHRAGLVNIGFMTVEFAEQAMFQFFGFILHLTMNDYDA